MREALSSESDENKLVREISMLQNMDHPFISRLFDTKKTSTSYTIVMEYACNGTLSSLLEKYKCLNEDISKKFFAQIVSALDYIHKVRHVVHRDLKADNIVLDSNNNIRLIDFGLSNSFTTKSPDLKTKVGTPYYVAPEVIKDEKYNSAADIWSLGVLLCKMITGNFPFVGKTRNEVLTNILYKAPNIPRNISLNAQDLLRRLLEKDHNQRIKLEEIKQHKWIANSKYSEILKYNFSKDYKFKIRNDLVDPIVANQIKELGYDIDQLNIYLKNNEENEIMALYRMLRTNEITNELDKFMKQIENNMNENFEMFNSELKRNFRIRTLDRVGSGN
ncbi:CAMK family protein kinase [Histomonas meleagridis]|uniref:CAMK family protein kinase n=1 Tax=Histomonas meleagridis TaxID=135588 RepID=UPI003559C6AB|nr:CAMK family protein kinase [Histomonas meleagridis]KAH0803209.1 CAMK family protein kinase [Histomonas meleagridis]